MERYFRNFYKKREILETKILAKTISIFNDEYKSMFSYLVNFFCWREYFMTLESDLIVCKIY